MIQYITSDVRWCICELTSEVLVLGVALPQHHFVASVSDSFAIELGSCTHWQTPQTHTHTQLHPLLILKQLPLCGKKLDYTAKSWIMTYQQNYPLSPQISLLPSDTPQIKYSLKSIKSTCNGHSSSHWYCKTHWTESTKPWLSPNQNS